MPENALIDILILGAGWTSTFLIPLCAERGISCAATTRTGRDNTVPFAFDPASDDPAPFKLLPDANTVLITFPITVSGASERLVRLYRSTRSHEGHKTSFVQLGTTGIWDGTRTTQVTEPRKHLWYDRHSPFTETDRARAEIELLRLDAPTTVLNLSGLWGGQRSTRNWVGRVAPTKEALKNKGSIHMIHGLDVSRAILAVHSQFSKASGQRWILTDGRVYDWWDLASAWGTKPSKTAEFDQSDDEEERGPQPSWVRELMIEEGVRALPRDVALLGRAMDSRDFWVTFGLSPLKARLEDK